MKRIFMFMGLCAVLFHTSCKSHQDKEEPKTTFLVTSPLKTDTSIIKDYVCQISAARHIELRAQERGYLQEILVDEGQFVKKGQLLFRIMPKLYEAEFRSAEAEAKVAEIEYQNTKRLADSDIVSVNELAMAKAKYDKAIAKKSLAHVHLEFTDIRAPFNGIIDKFHLKLGSLVEEGDLLTTLSDNTEMWVYFNVPEAEYLDYKTSSTNKDTLMTVELLMANNKLFDQKGFVKTIEADFNNETGNIAFRATFRNPDGLLRHGETGNILTSISFQDAIIIPQKATFEILDKRYVFVIEDSVVKQRQIEVGAEMPDLYIITKGLAKNEKILLEGLRKVTNGKKIDFEYKDLRSIIPELKLFTE